MALVMKLTKLNKDGVHREIVHCFLQVRVGVYTLRSGSNVIFLAGVRVEL